MQGLPLHPKIVHLPVALAVLVPLLAAALLVARQKGWLPRRAWVLACGAQALLLVSGLVAQSTGEEDEERVERFVPESALEAHEEAAESFVWAGGLVLVVAVAGLFGSDRFSRTAGLVTVVGSLVVLGLGYRVGTRGGSLVYEHGAAAAYTGNGPAVLPTSASRYEDDD